MTRSLVLVAPLAIALGAGCGGHTAKYKIDDFALAAVPVPDKQPIFDAQNEVTVARSEKEKVDADLEKTSQEIKLAKAERGQAGLEVDKTKVEAKMAETAKDAARAQQVAELRRIADLGKKAADAKVDMLEARHDLQRAAGNQADARWDAAVSRVELEKAKIAAARGITPSKDFDPTKFSSDYAERMRHYDEKRIDVDRKREKYDRAQSTYGSAQQEFEMARLPRQPPSQ